MYKEILPARNVQMEMAEQNEIPAETETSWITLYSWKMSVYISFTNFSDQN